MNQNLVLALLVGIVLFGAAACSESDAGGSKASSVSTSPAPPASSVGYEVAVIDDTSVFSEDHPAVIRANYLLGAIAPRCDTSATDVADKAVVAQRLLRDNYGIVVKVRDALEGVNDATAGFAGLNCAEIFAAWVVLNGS